MMRYKLIARNERWKCFNLLIGISFKYSLLFLIIKSDSINRIILLKWNNLIKLIMTKKIFFFVQINIDNEIWIFIKNDLSLVDGESKQQKLKVMKSSKKNLCSKFWVWLFSYANERIVPFYVYINFFSWFHE